MQLTVMLEEVTFSFRSTIVLNDFVWQNVNVNILFPRTLIWLLKLKSLININAKDI